MLSFPDATLLCKALADVTRLQIIDRLSCEELCACNLLAAFSISQPTLSYHMKILTESGLVKGRKDGAWMRYTLNAALFAELNTFIESISRAKSDCACHQQPARLT